MGGAPSKIRFGRWELDPQRRTLSAAGMPVALNGRAFDLLAFLVSRRGEPVDRDDVFAHVWPGITVGENNLTVQISNLRKVLGESGGDGAGMIVTLPGRRYAFAGEVCEAPGVEARVDEQPVSESPGGEAVRSASAGRWRWILAGLALLCCLSIGAASALRWHPPIAAARLSIAVLPFRSLGPDKTESYLTDALTDDLTTELAHIPASTVIARESADVWRGKAASVQTIGASLGARYLVEGSVLKEDGQYHVNAQLADAQSGAQIWALRFEAPVGRIGDVRDAIVRKLATALDFQVTQAEGKTSLRDRPDDADALDLFYQARAIVDWDDSSAGLVRAQHLLEQAIGKQPDFADALAELGTLLLNKAHNTDDADGPYDMGKARDVIARALALSPENAKALAAQGHSQAIAGDCGAAIYTARATLAIEPSSLEAEGLLADCERKLGHLDEATIHLRALLRLSPDGPKTKVRYLSLGYIHMLQGKVHDAVEELERATAGDDDHTPQESMGRTEVARLMLIAATQMEGNRATARRLYDAYNRVWPHRTVWRFGAMFTKADSAFPGTAALLAALGQAGMPLVADEHHVDQDVVRPCPGGEFDSTPMSIAGAATLDTQAVAAKLTSPSDIIVVDVSEGSASPIAATWYDYVTEQERPADFVRRIARSHVPYSKDEDIILMGSGTYDCTAITAVSALVGDGYTHVGWYRGGEEAWAHAGQKSVDRRPA